MPRRKIIPQPMVDQIDVWYREIGDKQYKITAHQTTPSLESRERIFYTYSFYTHEYSRSVRIVYEKLSREQIEQLFQSEMQKLEEVFS